MYTFFSFLPSIFILLWHVLLVYWKDDPDMMHDEVAAGNWTQKIGPNIKSVKFLGSGVLN